VSLLLSPGVLLRGIEEPKIFFWCFWTPRAEKCPKKLYKKDIGFFVNCFFSIVLHFFPTWKILSFLDKQEDRDYRCDVLGEAVGVATRMPFLKKIYVVSEVPLLRSTKK
jgi:hypothetical protein